MRRKLEVLGGGGCSVGGTAAQGESVTALQLFGEPTASGRAVNIRANAAVAAATVL